MGKEMATHSSALAWRIPGMGSLVAAVYGVAQSRARWKRLSSSSSREKQGQEDQLESHHRHLIRKY